MSSNSINGASKEINGSISKIAAPAATHNKATFAQKMAERKNEDEATAAAQRRGGQSQGAAWSGINPITQKPVPKTNGTAKPVPKSTNNPMLSKTLADRNNWVWNIAVGAQCTIVTSSSETLTGIFSGLQKAKDSNSQQFQFKMVKNQAHEYTGQGAEHVRLLSTNDVALIEIPEGQAVTRQINGAAKFRTDVDISGNLAQRERNLQRWEAPAGAVGDGGLESGNDTSGNWDQFKANERLFGLKTDYDENIYTTAINRSDPQYSLREREATRLAREIETSSSSNAHIREERGLDDSGLDEETKYSGVTRDFEPLQSNQPGRYVPPSRRSQNPISNELLDDPAIISSQISGQKLEKKQDKVEQPINEAKAAGKPDTDSKQSEISKIEKNSIKDTKPLASDKTSVGQPSATANVENELLDSFKQFTALEKIRIQDHKRNKASQDKAVKLNDLKKFSQNFKLCTPVPKDLIPILAKDEAKQKALVEKAQKNADTVKPLEKTSSALVDPKSQRPLAAARWENDGPVGDQNRLKGVPVPTGQMPKVMQSTRTTPGLSARLHESHRNHKAMAELPAKPQLQTNLPPTGPSGFVSPTKAASMRGPPSATSAKFNVKAMEFRPNPTASTFKPSISIASTAVASATSGSATRNASPAHIPAKLFGEKKTFGKNDAHKNPLSISTVKKPEGTVSTQNSGYNPPYKAFPTWVAPPATQGIEGEKGEADMKYYEAFDKWRARHPPTNTTSPVNPTAHQHQLPFHLQSGAHQVSQVHGPQPIPHGPGHHQFSHQPHFDDHLMRPSASNSSVYPAPSPRMHNPNVAYQSAIPTQTQVYGGQVQYVIPGQPQMGGRQYSNGPMPMAPVPQGHLAPMMVPQHSQGAYLPQPMAVPYGTLVYAAPSPGYPPNQHQNGFPSPGRQAPMMMQSTSHQGHQPQFIQTTQYAPPMYSPQPPAHARGGFGSPQPGYAQQQYQHYPHQPRRTPSTGYAHSHQPQVQHYAPATPQVNGSMEEDAK